MKGKWVLLSAAVVLLAIAVGAISTLRRTAPPARRIQPGKAAAAPSTISLPGQLRARDVVMVAAPVEGTLDFLAVEVGDEVGEGQLLGRIRNTVLEESKRAAGEELSRAQDRVNQLESQLIALRLEASRASADATRARIEFERVEKIAQRQQMLYREGATPRIVYEKAQKDYELVLKDYTTLRELASRAENRIAAAVTELDAAKRALDEKTLEFDAATADLQAAEVLAPAAGIVVGIKSKVGDEIPIQTQDLFQIAPDLTRMDVVLEPEPPLLALLHPGLDAQVFLAERPSESIPGTVREVAGKRVYVEFASPSPAIRPGLSAQVKIKLR